MAKKLNTNLTGFTKNVQTRLETLHDVEYIVAPVTMIVEGVLPGSAGPVMYTANEIQASVPFWDNVPVTINHPSDSSGNFVSARSPGVVEQFGVGQIYNTHFDPTTNSLKAEAWINKALIEERFPEVFNSIISGTTQMEISTGVFFDETGQPGDFNGISYNSIASSYHGDHLALLPNQTGACSWVSGCGLRANSAVNSDDAKIKRKIKIKNELNVNQLSFSDIERALWRYVDSLDNNEYYYYVDNIFDDFFTFERRSSQGERLRTLWKQSYSKINDIVQPTGEAIRVQETRSYLSIPEDAPAGTGISTTVNQNNKDGNEMADQNPCCPEKVESLIVASTNKFTKDDKEFLLGLNASQLESAERMGAIEEDATTNLLNGNEEDKVTTQQFIDSAPEHIKIALNTLVQKEADGRAKIIDTLTANEDCLFNKEELESFATNHLEKLSGTIAKKGVETNAEATAQTDMTGAAGVQTNATIPGAGETLSEEKTLALPKANWKV